MTDLGEAPRRANRPEDVRRWCEDFASRAGTYPFPLRTPAPWVAGSAERDALRRSSTPCEYGVLGTCDCVGPVKWEKRLPIQGFFRNLQRGASRPM